MHAFVVILVEQRLQHGAGRLAVFGEVLRLRTFSARSSPGQRRLVEGDVADQVEGVEVLADLCGQILQEHAVLCEFVDDGLLPLGALPPAEEVVERWRSPAPTCSSGVVRERLGDQLAVRTEILERARRRSGPRRR